MGNIASTILLACLIPYNVIALVTNFITSVIVKYTGMVLGVPSNIPLEAEDFIKHLCLWLNTCITPWGNTPKSLTHQVDNEDILIGFSCRSLFETSLNVLKDSEHLKSTSKPGKGEKKGQSLKILATPIHHKSYVEIMERIGTSIDILSLDESMRRIVIDKKSEEKIKNCDVIVVTHLFGKSFDLSELIELKNRYNKLLIVDGVMGGCRLDTHNTIGIDLDIYSTGQDKRPVAVGGGYCIIRHNAFAQMEQRTLSYRLVGRLERLKKILNTFMLRVLYQHRPLHVVGLFIMKVFNVKLSSVTGSVRKANPGFDHDNYLLCPNESMVQSVKLELPNIQQMEDKYTACWRRYLSMLPDDVRETFYPYYNSDEIVILPYNQILMPTGLDNEFLEFCDKHMIGCLGNQNYKALKSASNHYHQFNGRIMNFVTVIRPLDEIKHVTEKVTEFHRQKCQN